MFWQTLWLIVTTLQESLGLHWYFLSGWDMSGEFRTALQMVLPTGWSHSSLPKKCVWTSVGYNLTFLLPLPLLSLHFVVLVPLFYPESQLVIPEIAGADVCVWAAICVRLAGSTECQTFQHCPLYHKHSWLVEPGRPPPSLDQFHVRLFDSAALPERVTRIDPCLQELSSLLICASKNVGHKLVCFYLQLVWSWTLSTARLMQLALSSRRSRQQKGCLCSSREGIVAANKGRHAHVSLSLCLLQAGIVRPSF